MTGQTPVALWEPALARQSLPGGMPLTEPSRPAEATLLDARVINSLFSSTDALVWPTATHGPTVHALQLDPEDAPTVFLTPNTVTPDVLAVYAEIGSQIDVANQGVSIRYVLSQEPMPTTGPARGRSPTVLRESIERLRTELRLSADAVATLTGLSRRRYYEFRAGDEPPAARLGQIGDRVDFISGIAARNLPAAAELCRRHTSAFAALLSQGRLADAEQLFGSVVRERAPILPAADRPDISGPGADELLRIVEQPEFQRLLRLVRFLTPTIDAGSSERAAAALRMERNIHMAEVGDPVDAEWEFLLVKRPEAIAVLRARAEAVLRREEFTKDAWEAFVARESEETWGSFDYRPAEPLDPGPPEEAQTIDAGGWQPDLLALGVDLSLYDRRAR